MATRVSLLMMTAAAAGTALVGNAIGLAAAETTPPAARSRLGVAIADELGARNAAATKRGRSLDLREQALRAAEARLQAQAKARQGEDAPAPPTAAAARAQPGAPPAGGEGDQFDDLARIYQAMKPAAAALVLEQLDIDVQMRVAQRMRERSTAMILAAMTPKGAARLTMALARRQATAPVVAAR